MAQLEPLEHAGKHGAEDDGSTDCPACALSTQIYNEMSAALQQASRRLVVEDIAFILALLVRSVEESVATTQGRAFFWYALREHLTSLSPHKDNDETIN